MSLLSEIRKDLGDCTLCSLHEGRRNIVFGRGPAPADLMVVAAAPRMNDDQRGRPFAGNDGDMLNNMLLNVLDLMPGEVYMAYCVMCTPRKGTPDHRQFGTCQPFLKRQIAAVAPKVILALGLQATRALWPGGNEPLEEIRGQWRLFQGVDTLPTFHPVWLERNPGRKRDALEDLRAVREKLATHAATATPTPTANVRALNAQLAAMRQRVETLTQQHTGLLQQKIAAERANARLRAAAVGNNRHASVSPPGRAWAPIPADMLKKLIKICHPDKHQQTGMLDDANAVIPWLLEQKDLEKK